MEHKPTLTKKEALNLLTLLKPNMRTTINDYWCEYRKYVERLAPTNEAAQREFEAMERVIDDFYNLCGLALAEMEVEQQTIYEQENLAAYLEWPEQNQQQLKGEL